MEHRRRGDTGIALGGRSDLSQGDQHTGPRQAAGRKDGHGPPLVGQPARRMGYPWLPGLTLRAAAIHTGRQGNMPTTPIRGNCRPGLGSIWAPVRHPAGGASCRFPCGRGKCLQSALSAGRVERLLLRRRAPHGQAGDQRGFLTCGPSHDVQLRIRAALAPYPASPCRARHALSAARYSSMASL